MTALLSLHEVRRPVCALVRQRGPWLHNSCTLRAGRRVGLSGRRVARAMNARSNTLPATLMWPNAMVVTFVSCCAVLLRALGVDLGARGSHVPRAGRGLSLPAGAPGGEASARDLRSDLLVIGTLPLGAERR